MYKSVKLMLCCLVGLLLSLFGLPALKLIVFVFSGHKWFGPDLLTANGGFNDLMFRFMGMGAIFAVVGIAACIYTEAKH